MATKFDSDRLEDSFERKDLDAQLAMIKRSAEDTSTHKVIFDAIDIEKIKYLGSLRASALIQLTARDAENVDADTMEMYPKETIRERCAKDLLRAQAAATHEDTPKSGSGICRLAVVYRENKLSQLTGVPGRLVSGASEVQADGVFSKDFHEHGGDHASLLCDQIHSMRAENLQRICETECSV